MGYFVKTLKPTMPIATQIQSDKSDLAFSQGDILWDWFAFDVPRGANKLESVTAIVRGNGGSPQTARDIQLWFGKSNSDGTAPGSL